MQAFCQIVNGDDFGWIIYTGMENIFGDKTENGRYFTNLLTYIFVNYPFVRICSFSLLLFALFIILARLISSGVNAENIHFYASALFIMCTPAAIYSQTIAWISGFTNYIIGTLLSLLYIYLCLPILKSEMPKRGVFLTGAITILGFIGALCVENVTFFNIAFGVGIIVFSLMSFRKILPYNAAYLAGTLIGTAVMFMNSNYRSISDGDQAVGDRRYMEFGFSDIVTKLYSEVNPLYVKGFMLINIVIAVSVISVYSMKRRSSDEKLFKYSKPCLYIVASYAAYSVFTGIFCDFGISSQAYRMQALEAAYTFLYLISLIYLVKGLFDSYTFRRFLTLMLGSLIVSAPFLVANPANARCFFTDYIFWAAAAGTLAVYAADKKKLSDKKRYSDRFAFGSMCRHGITCLHKYQQQVL